MWGFPVEYFFFLLCFSISVNFFVVGLSHPGHLLGLVTTKRVGNCAEPFLGPVWVSNCGSGGRLYVLKIMYTVGLL